VAGLAGFGVYDIQERLPIRATVFLLLGDSTEILVAALGVSYVFSGVPRLTSVKALAKYSLFAIVLAPISVASVATYAFEGDSWWVAYLTEALALLTLTPAVLGWADIVLQQVKKPKAEYLEAFLLSIALVVLAYFAFVAFVGESRPALLYALVPLLLWAALRFGITGTSSSIVLISFFAILGAVQGRGPFTGDTPVHNVLWLQLFLLVAGISFMVLAALVEERGAAAELLRKTNQALEAQTAELQSREELLKIFVKNVPAGVAMLDRDMRYVAVSDRWCADYGVEASQVLGRSHYELLPDMPHWWKEVHRRALAGETLREDEERWERVSGTTWVRWEVLPWRTASGAVGGIVILAENITQRKKMEEEVVDVSRKLIQSQEEERARIGRELHDDINQRLSLLAVELDRLKDDPSGIEVRVHALQQQATEMSNDVQALSHELHSSKLDYLGVVPGIRSWCKEFGERQGMEIDFKADVSSSVPSEIGVTLFRILQEAFHNAAKHSSVKRIEVQLRERSDEIHLDIRDAGKGFEIGAARQGSGVGLASMDERVRLVKGTINIDSEPGCGTNIHVRIPLKSDRSYRRAAS
jgi:PAS domain S-box-containing protein